MASDADRIGYQPPHPGEYLREDILPALDMSITELAERLGVTRATLSELIHEKRAVSLQMAIRLGKAFETGARFWIALQMQHDLWLAERDFSENVDPVRGGDCEPIVA